MIDGDDRYKLLGQRLLSKGFATWFRTMFRLVEDRKFIVEPIHPELFETFEKIYNQKIKRVNINLPPRSAKTTLSKYFLVYGLTKNPRCNFIYTSYSQSLLNTISLEVRDILESPIYKKLYPNTFYIENEETKPVDEFWAEYLFKQTGKNTYSSKKIITYAGGNCLFASVGAQITGMGCGQRSATKFSGALILDDANKPADMRSELMRMKVLRYFEETLLSRLNNPNVPIVNIQQRLHLEDLSGLLVDKYNFQTVKRPLLDKKGVCLIPTQYTPERIKELQINNYMFSAQYQQEPIVLGGDVIKREWFKYYDLQTKYKYKKIVIAGDTAMTVKEHSDYTCFLVGGVTEQGKLHILDMVHEKLEYPELKQKAINTYNAWQTGIRFETSATAFYLENKASGIQLIQDLKKSSIPVIPIEVTKDKLARVEEVLEFIASGNVYLPVSENYGISPDIIKECEAFTRDLSQLHDDIVDTLVHLINNTIANRKVSILEVL